MRRLLHIIIFLAIIYFIYSQVIGGNMFKDFAEYIKGQLGAQAAAPQQPSVPDNPSVMPSTELWTNDNFPLRYGSSGNRVRQLWSYLIEEKGVEIPPYTNAELFNYTLEDIVKQKLQTNSISEQLFTELGIDQYPPQPNP